MKRIGRYVMYECTWDDLEDDDWVTSIGADPFDGWVTMIDDEDPMGEPIVRKVLIRWHDNDWYYDLPETTFRILRSA